MRCFAILVITSATFGSNIHAIPSPGVRTRSESIVPTHNCRDYFGRVSHQFITKQIATSEQKDLTVLPKTVPFAARTLLKVLPEFYLGAAMMWDLGIEMGGRSVCSRQFYGEVQ